MPTSFDHDTVQRLIDAIDQGHNASILEIGYFLRRGKQPLPQADGFALLASAADKEPVASKRWFVLQSVRGFAAFRTRDVSPDEGYQAYDAIFSHAADAQKADAADVVRHAILLYVFSVPGRLVELQRLSDARTGGILLKAWKAYYADLPPGKPGPPEPAWAAAIQRADLGDKFLPIVTKMLADPTVPKTYGLLKAAAVILQPTKPARAIALLRQAKPLLPPDKNEANWYYATLVGWLADSRQPVQAAAAAKEQVKATGHGQGQLARLQFQSGDAAGFKATMAALSAPDSDQQEINNAGEQLESLYAANRVKNKEAGDQAVTLLTQYLNSTRTRDIEQELHARDTLGGLLMQQGRFDEAHAVLTAGHYAQPLSTVMERNYYADIQQMTKELATRAKTTKDNAKK